jgi:hypothetical protein
MITILGFLLGGIFLLIHAWTNSRVNDITEDIQQSLSPNEILALVDLQIEHTKQRLHELEPGAPPPWYYPSYYYEWLPKARLYAEAQEALQSLRKQRTQIVEQGKIQFTKAKSVWNFGVSPIFHLLLAITFILTALRCMLRFALWKGMFGWRCLETK